MNRISVIIPTYNRAALLPAAVLSVLEQTHRADEIIVIDDGSTDRTIDSLAPMLNQIRYIKTANAGASAARNRGIREAGGDWIAFLDSDDNWLPEMLQLQIECLRETGAKVCFSRSIDERENLIDDISQMDAGISIHESRFYAPGDCRIFKHPRHPFVQSMVVHREALLRAGGFDESLKVAEDTKLIYQLALAQGYVFLNERLVKIRRERSADCPGLSDTMDPESAFERYLCYIRVQAEIHWRLVPIDQEAAAIVSKNLHYFVSRQAEIASALRREAVAKQFARCGLSRRSDWKSLLRNCGILLMYPLAAAIFSQKWKPRTVSRPSAAAAEAIELGYEQ